MNREMGKSSLEDTKEQFREIGESGEKIAGEGESINSILEGLNLDGLDADDIAALDAAKTGYSQDFSGAITEGVTEPTSDVSSKAESDISGLEGDKERVQEAQNQFEQAAGVSEIGRQNAEQGSSQMEQSANEYEQIIESNQEAINEADQRAQDFQSRIESLF